MDVNLIDRLILPYSDNLAGVGVAYLNLFVFFGALIVVSVAFLIFKKKLNQRGGHIFLWYWYGVMPLALLFDFTTFFWYVGIVFAAIDILILTLLTRSVNRRIARDQSGKPIRVKYWIVALSFAALFFAEIISLESGNIHYLFFK